MTPCAFADSLPTKFAPLRTYLQAAADATMGDGFVMAGHVPAKGPQYYDLVAWLPVTEPKISTYEAAFQLTIPSAYRELLLHTNGLAFRGCNLYGIPPSILASLPLLDRTKRQPLDIGAANVYWRSSFEAYRHHFHLGGFWYSNAENGALFQTGEGHIAAVLKSGALVGHWAGYPELLAWIFNRPETGV